MQKTGTLKIRISYLCLLLFVLCGCGQVRPDVHSLRIDEKCVPVLSFPSSPVFLSEAIEDMIIRSSFNKKDYSSVPSATVTDGTNYIIVGMCLDDLDYPEEPLPFDGTNRAEGYLFYGDVICSMYREPYEDMELYMVNYDIINRSPYGGTSYYIYQVKLLSPDYQTSDGIRVGMTMADLEKTYGESLVKSDDQDDEVNCYKVLDYPILFTFGLDQEEKIRWIECLWTWNRNVNTEDTWFYHAYYETLLHENNRALLKPYENDRALFATNPFEEIKEATVTDGVSSITLGMHLEDFAYGEKMYPWNETDWDNKMLPFNDFTLYACPYNYSIGDDGSIYYHHYIYGFYLSTPRFETSDGIRVGMTLEDLKEIYGEELIIREDGSGNIFSCTYLSEPIRLAFYMDEENVIKSILVDGMGITSDS